MGEILDWIILPLLVLKWTNNARDKANRRLSLGNSNQLKEKESTGLRRFTFSL